MKPHIRFKGRVWSCTTYRALGNIWSRQFWRIGYGYTPREAYEDWKAQT